MAGLEMIERQTSHRAAIAYHPVEDEHGDLGCVRMEEATYRDITRAWLEASYSDPSSDL